MADTASPTQANRGLLPVGTFLADFGGHVVQVSLTAYEVLTSPASDRSEWVSFDRVHGRPAPVMPLVVLS